MVALLLAVVSGFVASDMLLVGAGVACSDIAR